MVNDSTNIHKTNNSLLPQIIKHKNDYSIFVDVPLLHHYDDVTIAEMLLNPSFLFSITMTIAEMLPNPSFHFSNYYCKYICLSFYITGYKRSYLLLAPSATFQTKVLLPQA